MSTETKPSNPKAAFGDKKLPVGISPDTIDAEVALAFLEGALKYGRFNWRIVGVQSSTYHAALRRHLARWWNGEDSDPDTNVKHLASVIACAGILLDAELCKKLNDDRPPAAPVGDLMNAYAARVAHLKELFKDHAPKQFTVADRPLSDYHEVDLPYCDHGRPLDHFCIECINTPRAENLKPLCTCAMRAPNGSHSMTCPQSPPVDMKPKRQLHQRTQGPCECGDPACDWPDGNQGHTHPTEPC